MTRISSRTVRYTRAWLGRPHEHDVEDIVLDRDGVTIPATLTRPRGAKGRVPAWVVTHGITRPGRAHAQLVRFTNAVASAGIATIVPEVPEWRELRLAPELSAPTIRAAIQGLRESGVARDQPVGVVGFSFGAPHAIAAGGEPGLMDDIGGTAGFGGYCDLEATFRFMMTGRHESNGQTNFLRPDPYGRWIVAANYLTAVPGHEDAGDVAQALRALAVHASEIGAASWDTVYDPLIGELKEGISEARQGLFALLAPLADADNTPADGADLAEDMATAARRIDPLIDPADALSAARRPVTLLHGFKDHLIPFSESRRLAAALPQAETRLTITRLFGHSARDPFPVSAALTEVPRFLAALDRILRMT